MQKDVHFYLTYALAMKIGLSVNDAETIAWANQYTDDLTEADLYGIQTQAAILGNWEDTQVQLSVLIPFHFIPGSDHDHPWMTTRNNARARKLVYRASQKGDLIQLGIAFHALQDTFSHETFSGWREDINSCFPWYYLESALPNVGHAEMRVLPDVVNYIWTDPRNGRRIDNRKRTMSAARVTYNFLAKLFNPDIDPAVWQTLKGELWQVFRLDSYDKRIDNLCIISGNDRVDFKEVNARLEKERKVDFVKAASNHLAEAMKLFNDLPWTT
ncbi:MAG: hypothetical protein KAT58_07100 [candidate division Zixibacteria bacterium]|nr:hypothetical protein [candidate division Zixibacteria bacterium]